MAVFGQSGAKAWYQVLEVKGTASKQTDLFETKGSKWRIRWLKPAPDNHLSIYVYDKDGKPISSVLTQRTTNDESYIHQSGSFYLSINASDGYTTTIEDCR